MTSGGISNNTIAYCLHEGIDLNGSSPTILHNTITNCGVSGIYIYNQSNPSINSNSFGGNAFRVAERHGEFINAHTNWWGNATGPSGVGPGTGDAVSTNVNFSPWLGMPFWQTQAPILAPAIASLQSFVTNGFQLKMQGQIGVNYVIESSTDLITSWPIAYFTATNSEFYFNDSMFTNYAQRFYRAGIVGPQNDNSIPPTITSGPQSQTAPPGTTVNFAVAAIGTGPLTYQWYKNGRPLINGGTVNGANTSTLTLSGVAATDAGSYVVVVSNPVGPLLSSIGTLTVCSCAVGITVSRPHGLATLWGYMTPVGSKRILLQTLRGAGQCRNLAQLIQVECLQHGLE